MSRFFRKLYERFLRIRGNPRQIALGFALGLLIGFSPTMGIQILIAVFAAAMLKWNKFAAAAGVQITNPLTAPFIYSLTYYIGAKLIGLHKAFVWHDVFNHNKIVDLVEKAPKILLALAVGGIVLGIPVAIMGYYLSYKVLQTYQDRIREKLNNQKENLKQKFRSKRVKNKTKKAKKRLGTRSSTN
jgi:uncharacterized protein